MAKVGTQEASWRVGTERRCRKEHGWSMVTKWTIALPGTSQWTPGRARSLEVQAGEMRNRRRMGEGGLVTAEAGRGEEWGAARFENCEEAKPAGPVRPVPASLGGTSPSHWHSSQVEPAGRGACHEAIFWGGGQGWGQKDSSPRASPRGGWLVPPSRVGRRW